MKKLFLALLVVPMVFVFCGCGKNPMSPNDPSLPPVQHKADTFETHIARLKTPGHVFFWVKNFSVWDGGFDYEYNQNWYDWKRKGFPDQAYAVAYEMYNNYVKGENRGQCGQFAATYTVALREHGYRCGGILTYAPGYGHAESWFVEKNGTVTVTSNKDYNARSYPSYDAFIQTYRNMIEGYKVGSWHGDASILNEKYEIILDRNGDHFDHPIPLQ